MAITIGTMSFSEADVEGLDIHGTLDVDPLTGERSNPRLLVRAYLVNGQEVAATDEPSSTDPAEMGVSLFRQMEACGFTGVAYAVNEKNLVPVEPPTGLARLFGLPVFRSGLWVLSSAWVRPGTATYSSVSDKRVDAGLPGGGAVGAYAGGTQFAGDGSTVAGWLRG